jgi:hypothetical protein
MHQTLSINRGRLSVLVALIVLSFALLPLIEVPAAGSVGTSFLGRCALILRLRPWSCCW